MVKFWIFRALKNIIKKCISVGRRRRRKISIIFIFLNKGDKNRFDACLCQCVRQICFERSLFLGKLMLSKKILFSFLVQKVLNCLFNVYSTWADAYFSKNLSEFFELLDISWANIWFIWLSKWKAPNFDAHLCLNIAQKPQLSFRVFSSLFSDKK